LQTHLHQIQTTDDSLIYFNAIYDSIKLLKDFAIYVHQKRDPLNSKLPQVLIVQIFDFFPRRYLFNVGYLVCKCWSGALQGSSLAKHRRRLRTGAEYLHSWKLEYAPHGMALLRNTSQLIIVSGEIGCFNLWDTTRNTLVKGYESGKSAHQVGSNQTYICTYLRDELFQYSLEYKFIRKWKFDYRLNGLTLDDSFVYTSSKSKIIVHALEDGKFIREWEIQSAIGARVSKKIMHL